MKLKASRSGALAAGVVVLAGAIVLGLLTGSGRALAAAYLEAVLFWLGIALGSWAFLMIHNLVGGAWGRLTRPYFEASARTLPLASVLFLPVLFFTGALYPWRDATYVLLHPDFAKKASYLGLGFFAVRTVLYLAVWNVFARLVDRRPEALPPEARRRLLGLSASGLIVYALTLTLAATDWILSLDPEWFTTIAGVLLGAGQCLSAAAFAAVAGLALDRRGEGQPLHDFGNILVVTVLFWAYVAFSQYLIQYSAHQPVEMAWYHRRAIDAWRSVSFALVALHFAVPFFLLLFRFVKRRRAALAGVACLLLLAHAVDVVWSVAPELPPEAFSPWLTLALFVGVGAVWFSAYASRLSPSVAFPEER